MAETLADLIASERGAQSNYDLARASNLQITHTTWQRMAARVGTSESSRTITIPTVRIIASVLGVTQRRVWLAAGATSGLDVGSSLDTPLLMALAARRTEDLTPDRVDLIRRVADLCLLAGGQEAAGANVRAIRPEKPARAARKRTGSEGRSGRRPADPGTN